MADDGAPSAASQRLVELLNRANELAGKRRCEPAVAKFSEAIALARATTPPQSLQLAYALMRHAEHTVAQTALLNMRSGNGDGVDRATYAAEQALCATAYASLQEALTILLARAEANTLLPGRITADEAESKLQLVRLKAARRRTGVSSAADEAAQMSDARDSRLVQCWGYQVFLEVTHYSLMALYQIVGFPFPSPATQHEAEAVRLSVLLSVRWMGLSVDHRPEDLADGVQWQLIGGNGLLEEAKLCTLLSEFLGISQDTPTLTLPPDPFRRVVNELWHSPQLAKRRRIWTVLAPLVPKAAQTQNERADADFARLGLATCARADCGAVESCPKTFKTCARCHSVVYCGRECQLAAWPSHKHDCKRLAAEREAGAATSTAGA